MSFKNRCGNVHMRRQEPWQTFLWAYLSITPQTPQNPPAAPQRRPFIANVKYHWYNFCSLIYGRCLANRYFIQSSRTANHPPPSPPCPALSEKKPRTHLLTSKGMMLAGFTGGISGQNYKIVGNHTTLLSATGCSSVPGWRQLRTLCKTRLADNYFLSVLILFPPSVALCFWLLNI